MNAPAQLTDGSSSSVSPEPVPNKRLRVRPWHMWKVATTPRMIGFAIVIIVAVLACVKLGTWQLDRAVSKAEQAQAAELAARVEAPPVPIGDVVEPQVRFIQSMVGQRALVEGTFEGPEFFVPNKFHPDPSDPKDKNLWTHGYWVITPLRTAEGATMPIVRGWVEEADPAYLNAEGYEVKVTGALDGSDPAGADVDGNTIGAVSTGQLVNVWGGPIYAGYALATKIEGGPDTPAELPDFETAPTPVLEGGGLNLRNLAYAGEWFIFGGFAIAVWWRMVRDEAREFAAGVQPEGDG